MGMREKLEGKFGITAVVVLVLCVGLGVWAMVRPSPNTPDTPDGLPYLCRSCKTGFVRTMKQVSDHQLAHYGEPMYCPKCNSKETERANKCAKCGEFFPMTRNSQPACPKCGTKPAPPA